MSENEYDHTDQFVPTYINSEPVVLAGLTEFELSFSIGFFGFFSLVTSIILGVFLFGFWAIFAFLAIWIAGAYAFINYLRRFKKGKPKGYVVAVLRRFIARHMTEKPGGAYLVDKPLKVGRSQQLIVLLGGRRDEDSK